ncbi:MAG: hypothetical protein JJ926_10195 [Roseitalea sp.]|jgi:hypothetical protein|uniref:hypothetical protein n=1 Tax=Oceaniradius stylonematis TaxID=2184161 RepID=UPI001B099381|nr:hypothetical protein [Oceaniradius stylonematis]MBO6551380.1 hypothetical protein [Roseitalea sp.]MBO6952240.1 hypothetical protein [Rhizobiaceae bacterium]MBO6591914.1 hypothetical protein [Roseitalea sp.]MBO6598169.1 hypothetical protein [Roseitalea sp.]MBO6610615.1 hypothetical protein [Roseitalea sp.]
MTQARKGRGRRPIRHMVASKAFYDRLPPGAELLMLSPMVMAMRLPMVLWELSTPQFSARRGRPEGHRAVFEKAAAVVESYGAAQAEMARSAALFWIDAFSGAMPDPDRLSRSLTDLADASIEPHARRVRANYRRLRADGRKRTAPQR